MSQDVPRPPGVTRRRASSRARRILGERAALRRPGLLRDEHARRGGGLGLPLASVVYHFARKEEALRRDPGRSRRSSWRTWTPARAPRTGRAARARHPRAHPLVADQRGRVGSSCASCSTTTRASRRRRRCSPPWPTNIASETSVPNPEDSRPQRGRRRRLRGRRLADREAHARRPPREELMRDYRRRRDDGARARRALGIKTPAESEPAMRHELQVELARRVSRTSARPPTGPSGRRSTRQRVRRCPPHPAEINHLFRKLPLRSRCVSGSPAARRLPHARPVGRAIPSLVRRDDGGVDAFVNVCRHRGTRQWRRRQQASARSRARTGWTYGRAGSSSPYRTSVGFSCLDKSTRGARAAPPGSRCCGFVWVIPRAARGWREPRASSLADGSARSRTTSTASSSRPAVAQRRSQRGPRPLVEDHVRHLPRTTTCGRPTGLDLPDVLPTTSGSSIASVPPAKRFRSAASELAGTDSRAGGFDSTGRPVPSSEHADPLCAAGPRPSSTCGRSVPIGPIFSYVLVSQALRVRTRRAGFTGRQRADILYHATDGTSRWEVDPTRPVFRREP